MCAAAVLSAAGHTGGDDLLGRAGALVGAHQVENAGRELLEPWLQRGGRVLTAGAAGWPSGLSSLGEAEPVLLWLYGQLPTESDACVAIVGSRRCTDYGRECARRFAEVVVGGGRQVVSGGAFGIDAAAHEGSLAAGGRTVLYAAGGAGHIYPARHEAMFRRAAGSGAVVWEHPPGTPLSPQAFLHRNRLIAATAGVTVVVEAAQRSGALNTGRSAADLGRLVLAVPGRIDSPSSGGVHQAIADGWAALVMGPEDLGAMLGDTAWSG